MAILIAQGRKTDDRWRRTLAPDEPFVLGREAGTWAVPWDFHISRRHAALTWRNGALEVQRLPSGRNPIFVHGTETARFELKPGEHFVIGETTFTLAADPVATTPDLSQLVKERTFSAQKLKNIQVRDASHQIDVLSRLPEVISGAANDQELFVGLVNLLLAGIGRADAVALVRTETTADPARPAVRVVYWDRRQATQGDFQPSNRLILTAIRQQETVMHVWAGKEGSDSFTQDLSFDWAYCTPLPGEHGLGWGIYVAGRFAGETASSVLTDRETVELVDDLKFTELAAEIWSSLRQVDVLKHRQAILSQFLSPAVVATMAKTDPEEALKPRKAEVTVLFCDLRGFSRESEKGAHDLLALLERVSKALGFMTQNILDQGGVIGDFQGDAAMGFWGWPFVHADRVQRACQAALGIRALFEAVSQRVDHTLAGFRVGIGIASGPAVAGKIGTASQGKVSVFGPVVNLASRLEGMTKILRAPILLDDVSSKLLRENLPSKLARLRRLAVVRPYGMDTALTVSELLPPVTEYSLLTDQHLADYEAALDALQQGQWVKAYELLHELPAQDRGKDFLTAFIIQHNHMPPPTWDGVIPLSSKS